MPWYAYKRGGWEIAVDAVSQRDASRYMKWQVPSAEYQGPINHLPTWNNPSTKTAMVTPERERQIRKTP